MRPPIWDLFLSISCTFYLKTGCAPPHLWQNSAPPFGKSWIRHCFYIILHLLVIIWRSYRHLMFSPTHPDIRVVLLTDYPSILENWLSKISINIGEIVCNIMLILLIKSDQRMQKISTWYYSVSVFPIFVDFFRSQCGKTAQMPGML